MNSDSAAPVPSPSASTAGDAADGARVGLAAGQRYRCQGCGNLTRFDVRVTERARRFWHADLSGSGRIDDEERETIVESVQCRWCGSADVVAEPSPSGEPTASGEQRGQ